MYTYVKKAFLTVAGASLVAATIATPSFAHVVVKPGDVATASYQIFTVSVPNEKSASTIAVKVLIPESLTSVTPTTKPGWTISTEKSGNNVSSITWKNGTINDGFRDDFTFSAKTPDSPTELQWKAYQTYDNGDVVSWDKAEDADHSNKNNTSGPFSVTNVADTTPDTSTASTDTPVNKQDVDHALYVGAAGVAIAFLALFFATRKKQ